MSSIDVDLSAYVTAMRSEAENCAVRGEYAAAGLLVGAGKIIADLAGQLAAALKDDALPAAQEASPPP